MSTTENCTSLYQVLFFNHYSLLVVVSSKKLFEEFQLWKIKLQYFDGQINPWQVGDMTNSSAESSHTERGESAVAGSITMATRLVIL